VTEVSLFFRTLDLAEMQAHIQRFEQITGWLQDQGYIIDDVLDIKGVVEGVRVSARFATLAEAVMFKLTWGGA
jgi:hypothetical protein